MYCLDGWRNWKWLWGIQMEQEDDASTQDIADDVVGS